MNELLNATGQIRGWGEARQWKGFDPYDALNSPYAQVLTLGTELGRRAFTQGVKLCPVNLRPVLGIKPEWNAKAVALVASAYSRLAAAGDETARQEAERWLTWLVTNHAGDDEGLAWGYHFDVQTRFFFYRRGTPNTIATSFAGQALLDGVELLGDDRWGDPALSVIRFLSSRMRRDGYFRYLPDENELVHNANLLACAVFARAGGLLGQDDLLSLARPPLTTSLRAQRDDGSWPYAEGPSGNWVDNFHTGYVLESLVHCSSLDRDVEESLTRGLHYWQQELFLGDGTPKYTPGRTHPIDAHCYATAIDTLLAASSREPGAFQRAERIASLLIDRMLDPAGFVRFQERRFWTSRVPFVRWSTAPSFRALAGLLRARSDRRVAEDADARLD